MRPIDLHSAADQGFNGLYTYTHLTPPGDMFNKFTARLEPRAPSRADSPPRTPLYLLAVPSRYTIAIRTMLSKAKLGNHGKVLSLTELLFYSINRHRVNRFTGRTTRHGRRAKTYQVHLPT
jgi:hypothetical protein